MRVLVVGNYASDSQQSMMRYSQLLVNIYSPFADVVFDKPREIVSCIPTLSPMSRKYLAYIDKLIIFPFLLVIRSRLFDRVHIADHGNAYYSLCLPRSKSIVTCHDLLALRGALGDVSTACRPSIIGIWLQRLIIVGLRRSGAVAFVSRASFQDFKRLIGKPSRQRRTIIPNPLNAPFAPDLQAFHLTASEYAQVPKEPFLLMVGSAHPRKNRALALQLLEYLGVNSSYYVVFAGAPLSEEEKSFCHNHPLGNRLTSIERPSHALLNRLYCQAHALLFPSFAEGFGWPLVEAQTCRCPVIASPTTSIPEVAGEGALYAEPTDVATFASHVRTLQDPAERARLIALGLANTRRFNSEVVAEAYRRFSLQACS
jgi:glycosyltransferase involved in cell wall biosynthesis